MLAPYVAMDYMPELIRLSFRFQVNGTSGADFQVPAGAIKSIGDTADGVFAIQLADGFRPPVYLGCVGSVMCASGAGFGLIVQSAVADYSSSTGIVTVRTVDPYTDATPAAAVPADNDWVYVELVFCRRTSLSATGAVPA